MRKNIVAISILLVIVSSCKTTKHSADVTAPVDDTIVDNSFRKLIRSKEIFNSVTEVIPLDTVYFSKDTLCVFTKRIPGCDEENFKLIWNGAMLKSLPRQANVKLFQQVDPACKESHRFLLSYNVKHLRFKEDSISRANPDSLSAKATIVRVGGWKNGLRYKYKDTKQ